MTPKATSSSSTTETPPPQMHFNLMKKQIVFVDANILFSKTLMDWLFFLREENPGMFQLIGTQDVFSEVLYNMRRSNPRAPGIRISRRLELMKECMDSVVSDFPGGLDFSGADKNDYHAHAAATSQDADFILTQDRPSDFTSSPDNEVSEIIIPDDFFTLVADSNPHLPSPYREETTGVLAGTSKPATARRGSRSCSMPRILGARQ